MDELNKGKSEKKVIEDLIENDYNYLSLEKREYEETPYKDFTTNIKSAIYIKDAIQSATKCKICDGLIHKNSNTEIRKEPIIS